VQRLLTRGLAGVAWAIALLIIGLNVKLLSETFFG
jgi:hypothetical protein